MPETPAPTGWKWSKLTDLARLESGHTPSRKHPEYWDDGDICWIGIRDATANHGQTLEDTNQHATQLGVDNSSARILPQNTVCLSRTASVGYVVVMGKPMATSQDFVNWVCSDKLNHQFLKYILLSENRSFLRFASGTTHQTIYFPEVKAFHICLPPLPEQHAIAHMLGSLDDKIELNRKMNTTLEAMAQAIFNSWFVDFDPAIDNALVAGNPIPEALADRAEVRRQAIANGTANREAAQAFPDSFQETEELGWIPEGWEVGQIKDIATFENGDRGVNYPKVGDFFESGIPFINAGHISDGSINLKSANRISREKFDQLRGGKVKQNDLLFCLRGSPGRIASVGTLNCGAIASSLVIIRPSPIIDVAYLYYSLSGTKGQKMVGELNNGSAQPNISVGSLQRYPVLIPETVIVNKFEDVIKMSWEKLHSNKNQNSSLTKLRDTLLPKLISGDLRVPEAEQLTQVALA
jgi:type I restriction enzyme S subunit